MSASQHHGSKDKKKLRSSRDASKRAMLRDARNRRIALAGVTLHKGVSEPFVPIIAVTHAGRKSVKPGRNTASYSIYQAGKAGSDILVP